MRVDVERAIEIENKAGRSGQRSLKGGMQRARSHLIPWMVAFMVAFGLALHARGQDPPDANIQFERLEGLSHNTVFDVLQDQQGFLWIGTADGLNRYDGYEFVVHRHLPADSTSLVDNTVQALAEDPSGDLWVGTASGLDRLNRSTGRFVHYDLTPDSTDAPTSIAQIAIDRAGHIWVTTYPGGALYSYDRRAGTFEQYDLGEHGASVRDVEVDAEGTVWAIGGAHPSASRPYALYQYHAERDRFRFVRSVSAASIHAGTSSGVWVRGIKVAVGQATDPPVQTVAAPMPSGGEWRALLETPDSSLWIGTDRGVYRYNLTTDALEHHAVDTSGTAELGNYVWTLYEDRAGILWVGTRSGLYRYDPHRKPFRHLGASDGVLKGPGESAVMALQEGSDGMLWAGTLGGGLVRMGPDGGAPPSADVRVSLPSDNVWALHEARAGQFWVGTDAGPCVLNRSTGRCVLGSAWDQEAVGPGPIYTIAEQADGTLWMAGTRLYRVDGMTGRVATPVPLKYGRDFTTIQALHLDAARRLWIGMEGGGLARYHLKTDTLVRYPYAVPDGQAGLRSETVWTIHESAEGLLWLGTDVGLARLDPQTDSLRHYFDAERLPGSIIYSMLEDGQGRLWVGTNHGLVRFDPDTGAFRQYGRSDGVRNLEFNRGAALRGAQGTLYFGGLHGITAFRPQAIRDNPHPPSVAITGITKVNQEGRTEVRPHGREQLTFSYRDRVFTFTFSALNFTNPQKNRYAYQLEGFDAEWIEAGTQRVARYTNVPPGRYVLRVRAANNDGVWNETGTTLRVTITPPFWKTWWFQVAVVVALLGVVVGLYRARVAYLLRMERMRLRIASDLHDDVGSQLASVAIMSDVLRARDDLNAATRAELRHIGSVIREATETLRDIVWFVDPEHDDPEALFWKMKTEASTVLGALDVQFDHPPPEEWEALSPLNVQARRNLFLILREALHNIVRHAEAEAVHIRLSFASDQLELMIRDDGVGFTPEADDRSGHGLANMRRRAEQMGGTLEVQSQPAQGARVRLTVPIP